MKPESTPKDPNNIEAQLRSLGMATKKEQEEGEGDESETTEPELELTEEQQEELEVLLTQANAETDPNKQLELLTQIKDKLKTIKESLVDKEISTDFTLIKSLKFELDHKTDLDYLMKILVFESDYRADGRISSFNFPNPESDKGKEEINVDIIKFDEAPEDFEEALKKIDKLGYRPANVYEMLWMILKNDKNLENMSIAALGSPLVKEGKMLGYPFADKDVIEKRVGVDNLIAFLKIKNFAVVRKSESEK